jgi:hypothetical protein
MEDFMQLSKTLSRLLVAAGALVMSVSAQAAAFTYNETAGFNCASANPPPGPGSLDCTATIAIPPASSVDQSIAWVSGSNPVSELLITNPAGFNPVTLGTPFEISRLTHINRIIPVSGFVYSIDILGRLQIREGAANVLDNVDPINISFTETLNSEPCPAPNPVASVCDDRFDFDVSGLAPLVFAASDGTYRVDFFLEALAGTFVDGATVYTREDATSQLRVLAVINRVPEPATLAVFGLGLLGLGFAQRRNKKS